MDQSYKKSVPFYIRTGKRLKEKSTRIVIEFKEISKTSQATADGKVPNLLVIEISPNEGITLQLNTRDPQHKGEFMPL